MTNERSLLAPERFLQVPPTLACAIGLNEAIVLQHLYWLQNLPKSGRCMNGKNYIFNTYAQWRSQFFPFWSEHTIQRIMLNLEGAGYVESVQPDGRMSRKKYYRVSDAAISNLTKERYDRSCQLGTIDHANLAAS